MTNLINTALDIYQVLLQKSADKREFRNIDNNLIFRAICLNNELLNNILVLLQDNNYKGKEREITMHNTLIQKASEEQIKSFTANVLNRVKSYDKEMYDELEMELYKEIYGCHFNDWLLDYALASMINEDGSSGGHWTLDQTNQVARQYDINFDTFNEYDWNYVMNMIYSDYYGAVSNDVSSYVKLAKKFLMDKDSPKGKAYYYYMAMKY